MSFQSSLRRAGPTGHGCATLLALLAAACGGSRPPTTPTPPPGAQLTITCPATVEGASVGGAAVQVAYATPTASGGTAPASVTCAPASGTLFPVGNTTVSCSAVDSAGRQASCSFSVAVAAIPQVTRTRFLAFGDSLTEGKLSALVAFGPILVDAGPHSYPSMLRQLLSERYTSQQMVVVNEGLGGERADGSQGRFAEALSTHRPEAVLLLHGVNDVVAVRSLDDSSADLILQKAVDAVEDLTKMARSAGLTAFVATLPPLGPPKASCSECADALNDRLRGMVAAKGAVLVDVYEAWGGRPGLMGADGIHPTEAGYEAIARAFLDAIQRTLESPPPGTTVRTAAR